MNPVMIVTGFVPFIVSSVLGPAVGVGWAAVGLHGAWLPAEE